jgi:hypothetical protein
MLADDLVWYRVPGQGHLSELATRRVDGLSDRLRHLVRLTRREADATLAVADRHERVERESPAALYDLGDAIDRDDVLDEVTALARALVAATTTATSTFATAMTTAIAATAFATAATGTAATASTTLAAATAAGTTASTTPATATATAPAPTTTTTTTTTTGTAAAAARTFRALLATCAMCFHVL